MTEEFREFEHKVGFRTFGWVVIIWESSQKGFRAVQMEDEQLDNESDEEGIQQMLWNSYQQGEVVVAAMWACYK